MRQPDKYVKQIGQVGNVLSLGLTGGICVALSLFAGYQFDHYLSSEPYGIILGIIVGIAAAFIQTWKQLKESMGAFTRSNERTKDKDTQL